MMLRFQAIVLALLGSSFASWLTCSDAFSQDLTNPKQSFAAELPRTPARETSDAMAAIQVKDGYKLELAAAEPLVRDPVAMAFDENGRLFVVEMCDYSEQDKEFLGNVRMLEDNDNDGKYEKSTLFAHHLSWPTGVICYDGGVFVAAAPDIWYCKDTDGDGQADIQTQIYTGFGRQNVQGLMNSFCWGIDNRIYGQTSSSGASVVTPSAPDREPIPLSGRDFSFDPKTLELRPESGGGQHGMCFDDWGRRFTCQNSDHLQLHVYADRYSRTKSNAVLPPSRQSIAADGPQAPVYRISPVEPWRTVRTRLRVTHQVAGPVEGGGRSSGYFTSATGINIYRGNAFPDDMLGVAFVGDVGSNIVHRKRLTEHGASMVGHRIDADSEFIAASDIWFRPVQFANAPDGTLYIADLYREVIEHPQSLPQEIKQHLDLTSGRDRGRIYRLVPKDFQRPPAPKLGNATIQELTATLEHPNGWHRDTASRLLYEKLVVRADGQTISDSIDSLKQVAVASKNPKARVHAMGVLARIGAGQGGARQGDLSGARAGALSGALADSHPKVREWAIRFQEDSPYSPPVAMDVLSRLALDEEVRVRFQLALSLDRLRLSNENRLSLALQLLSLSPDDTWLTPAILNAVGQNAFEAIELLGVERVRAGQVGPGQENAGQENAGQGRAGQREQRPTYPPSVWKAISKLAGLQATREQLLRLDQRFKDGYDNEHYRQLSMGLISALHQRFKDKSTRDTWFAELKSLETQKRSLVQIARNRFGDEAASLADRLEAVELLGWEQLDSDVLVLTSLLTQRTPQPLQEAATRALMRYQSPEVANQLLIAWPSLSPKLRSLASDVLLSRTVWIEVFLASAGQGGFALNELDPARTAALRNHPEPSVREKLERAIQLSPIGNRQDILKHYQASLTMQGDQVRGKQAFVKACAACHRLGGLGYELGPNIASYKYRGAAAILQNVLEPNREVNPLYLNYSLLTNDDRIVTGIINNESGSSVTLVRGENVSETVARSEIAEMKSSKMSIMPEGLESQLDLQGMADLIAYITSIPE